MRVVTSVAHVQGEHVTACKEYCDCHSLDAGRSSAGAEEVGVGGRRSTETDRSLRSVHGKAWVYFLRLGSAENTRTDWLQLHTGTPRAKMSSRVIGTRSCG